MNLIVFLPFVVLTLFLLWRSGRWERKVIQEELANELADTVTPEEYEGIKHDGVFAPVGLPPSSADGRLPW